MPARIRPTIETPDPELVVVATDDQSRTLKCKRTGVTWHSESGALSESLLVFLENSGMKERLAGGPVVRVLETGFGTGLNFWLTASLAINSPAMETSGALEYLSLETQLLSAEVFRLLEHGHLKECQPAYGRFSQQLFESARKLDSSGGIQLESENVKLTVQHPDEFSRRQEGVAFDVIYHDPFGPEDAPPLWSEDYLTSMRRLLRPDGCLVTYCVKSEIQRRLKSTGFNVRKTRGPAGGKREVLIATPTVSPS